MCIRDSLVQLAMPDGYGIRGFVRDNLPVIPDTFTLVPVSYTHLRQLAGTDESSEQIQEVL